MRKITTSPYYIVAPSYRESSSGVRVLHRLCHEINVLGYEAYITTRDADSRLRTPALTTDIELRHAKEGRIPVTVYPEVISGNPRNAPVVARYMLNHPGFLGGDEYYDEKEILFAYIKEFIPERLQAELLYITVSDLDLFNPNGVAPAGRTLQCFFAHRYLKEGHALLPETEHALELSHRVPRTLAELAEIFRKSEILYSYERSAICLEAMLCGCPVVYIPNEYLTELPIYDVYGRDGIAWGLDSTAIEEAKRTVGKVYANHLAYERQVPAAVSRFIDITQRAALDYWRRRIIHFQPTAGDANPSTVEIKQQVLKADDQLPDFVKWHSDHQWSYVLCNCARRDFHGLSDAPKIHFAVILPHDKAHMIGATIASLSAQVAGEWRLSIIAERALSEDDRLPSRVEWFVSDDPLRTVNAVLGESAYDWVGMIEAGDLLENRAVFCLAWAIHRHRDWQLLYTDEDSVDAAGMLTAPYFKPEFSPEMLHAAPFAIGGMFLLRRDVFLALKGYDPAMLGIEQYDLALRAYERVGKSGYGHLADILYHRHIDGRHHQRSQEDVEQLRLLAVVGHLDRLGQNCAIDEGLLPGTLRIRHQPTTDALVSMVIPTHNGGEYLQRCIGAIVENTAYKNWEIIVVDSGSDDATTLAFLAQLQAAGGDQARVICTEHGKSLPELMNLGAGKSRGQYLLFLSDACAPLRDDWLDEMLGYAGAPGVGVVGARLIAPDRTISHAGYLLGYEGKPAALHSLHAELDDPGYFGRLALPHNPSAISAACMLLVKANFDALGGFDAETFPNTYSDVDLCMRLQQGGLRVVWTPHALLLHEHSSSQTKRQLLNQIASDGVTEDRRRKRFKASPQGHAFFNRWVSETGRDQAYNPNLSLTRNEFDIETMQMLSLEKDWRPLPRLLAHPGDLWGCGEYRVISPMRVLHNRGSVQGVVTPAYFSIPELERLAPDTIIFQRQIDWGQIEHMREYLSHNQSFRIYELDDLITNIQLSNQHRLQFVTPDLIKRFRQALSLCDRLVVSTDYLAEEYRVHTQDTVVVRNYLENARWGRLKPARNISDKPRVGWAGGSSHTGDLKIIIDVVKATTDEIDWVFLGMCPKAIKPLVKEFHAGVPLDAYAAKLASLNLDLAIAPLEDVPFNHAKSHLRVLEYGILGYPVIASDITPYRGAFPITRVRNRFKDWVDAIREHVSDRDDLARRGDALREHILSNWMLDDHYDIWMKAWLP